MLNNETEHPHTIWDRNRLINFTDAIFAIAITLLAFNLHIPPGIHPFSAALGAIHTSLVGFFISFAVIGYIWLGHNRMFHYIREVDRRVFLLHLVFLATISFLPFASNALENFGNDRGAVIFYASSILVVTLTQLAIWMYVRSHKALLETDLEPRTIDFITSFYSYTPVVFLISIIVGIFSATAAEYVWIALFIERTLLRRFYHVRNNQAE
jgi:uncharacterized membrane protein